jgi:hypothetical protein
MEDIPYGLVTASYGKALCAKTSTARPTAPATARMDNFRSSCFAPNDPNNSVHTPFSSIKRRTAAQSNINLRRCLLAVDEQDGATP